MIGLVSLIPLLVVVAIVALLVRPRGSRAHVDPGIGSVRRIVLYALGFVALIFAAVGISLLLTGALDAAFGDLLLRERRGDLAVALAFATVGIPAWLALAWVAHRVVRRYPGERFAVARRWYINLVRGTALVVVVVNAIEAGHFVARLGDFEGAPWGWLVAWAAIWLLHDRLAAAERTEDAEVRLVDRLYAYFGAVLGLVLLLVGLVQAIGVPLDAAYDAAFRDQLRGWTWDEGWREALVVAAIGGLVWSWHWLLALDERDAGTTLWRVYVFLFGILVGVGMTLIPAGILLYSVLEWFVGEPVAATAVEHFDDAPGTVAVLLVGLATWIYHRVVVAELGDAAVRSEPERIYRYTVAAAGLAAVAMAIVVMLALLLDVATDESGLIRPDGWWRNDLVAAVTLLIVGAPLWGYHWWRTSQAVAASGLEERESTSRRVYVFGVLGASALAVLIALVVVLYLFFELLLEVGSLRDTLRDARVGIAVILAAGAIAVYHWLVLREDQAGREAAEAVRPAVRHREVVLLAPGGALDVALALEAIPGVHLARWRRLDDVAPVALSSEELTQLRDAVAAAEHERVAVLLDGAGYHVVPYRHG